MTVSYVNQMCEDSASLRWDSNSQPDRKPPDNQSNLIISDASAYVSKIASIPEGNTFLMSRLFEKSDVITLDFVNAASMSDTLDRISYFVESLGKQGVPTLEYMDNILAQKRQSLRPNSGSMRTWSST